MEFMISFLFPPPQVSIMFVVVLIVFGVCWLPYHTYFIYSYYNTSIISQSYTQHLFLAAFWLAMANSAINPIIFFLMSAKYRITSVYIWNYTPYNRRFRQCLRNILTWLVIIFTRSDFCDESSHLQWWDGEQEDENQDPTPSFQSLSCSRKRYFCQSVFIIPLIHEVGTLRLSPVLRETATVLPVSSPSSSTMS